MPRKAKAVYCAYCYDDQVPATKKCLFCNVPLCTTHQRLHRQGGEHILEDLNAPMVARKCPQHNKPVSHYCLYDRYCLCDDCKWGMDHRQHAVIPLHDAFNSKMKRLQNAMDTLTTKQEKILTRKRQLEMNEAELTQKMEHVSTMLNTEDAFMVLMEQQTEKEDFFELQEDRDWKWKTMVAVCVFFALFGWLFSGKK